MVSNKTESNSDLIFPKSVSSEPFLLYFPRLPLNILCSSSKPFLGSLTLFLSTSTLAKVDDTITLTFTAAETIGTPTVTFQSGGAAINDGTVSYANPSGNTWTAKYDANTGDTEGSVTFSIAFSDSTGNAGTITSPGKTFGEVKVGAVVIAPVVL